MTRTHTISIYPTPVMRDAETVGWVRSAAVYRRMRHVLLPDLVLPPVDGLHVSIVGRIYGVPGRGTKGVLEATSWAQALEIVMTTDRLAPGDTFTISDEAGVLVELPAEALRR